MLRTGEGITRKRGPDGAEGKGKMGEAATVTVMHVGFRMEEIQYRDKIGSM